MENLWENPSTFPSLKKLITYHAVCLSKCLSNSSQHYAGRDCTSKTRQGSIEWAEYARRLSDSSSWTVPQILCSCPEGRTPPPPPCGLFFSLLFFLSVFFFTIRICSSIQLSIMRWKLNALKKTSIFLLYSSATSPWLTPLLIPLSLLSFSLSLSLLSLSLSLSLSVFLSLYLSLSLSLPLPPLCLSIYPSLSLFLPLQSRHLSGIVGTYANSNIRCTWVCQHAQCYSEGYSDCLVKLVNTKNYCGKRAWGCSRW